MSFALVTDDVLIAWDEGKVQGFPAEALVDAELAIRRGTVAATPTGPWFEQGTPEAAYLALRKLWPDSEVEGDPPQIGPFEDERPGPGPGDAGPGPAVAEARYVEGLHPRDRLGRWREKMYDLHRIKKADVIAGKVPGFKYDPHVSSGVAAHMRDEEMTLGPGAFRSMGEEVEYAGSLLMAHEIGHRVGQHITARGSISDIPEIEAFRGEGQTFTRGVGYIQRYENPFGASERPEEMLADAYSELLHFGLRGAGWEALPGDRVLVPGRTEPGEIERIYQDRAHADVRFPDGSLEKLPTAGFKPADEPTDAHTLKRMALLRLVQQAARELGLPSEQIYRITREGTERIEEAGSRADYAEALHPRDRRGRWRKKERGFAQMIRQTMSMKAATVDPKKLHYIGFEGMVLKHGLLFKHGPDVTPTEREYSATTEKECFLNATHAALEHHDLTYVEGYAYNGILPIHHAWLVDDDGVVHDPTWASMQGREGEADIYVGIPFKTDWLLGHLAEKETYGVYGEWGEGLKLTEPIPEEAIETGVKGTPVPKEMQGTDPQIMSVFAQAKLRETMAEPDEEEIEEAYVEGLHPRDRRGRWREKFHLPKPPMVATTTGRQEPLSETFKDTRRAEEWFRQRWPDKQFDFALADMDLLGPALVQFVRLAERFPFAVEEMAGIVMSHPDWPGDSQLAENAIAGVRRTDQMLLLSPAEWPDKERFLKGMQAADEAEWHPPEAASPEAMMTHEFGHLLDNALMRADKVTWTQPYGHDYGVVSETWKWWKKDTNRVTVSGYAKAAMSGTFPAEGEVFAEAFSELMHTPPELRTDFTRRYGFVLDAIADESKWKPLVNDESISFKGERTGGRAPLTEDEIEAWKEQRREWAAQAMGELYTVSKLAPPRAQYTEEVQKPNVLHQRYYPPEFHEHEKEVWDNRRARFARLRGQKEAREEAERKASLAISQPRLEWRNKRARELIAQGMSQSEAKEQTERERLRAAESRARELEAQGMSDDEAMVVLRREGLSFE